MLSPGLQREGAAFISWRNIISVQHSGLTLALTKLVNSNLLLLWHVFSTSSMPNKTQLCCWKCKTTTKNSSKVEQCSEE